MFDLILPYFVAVSVGIGASSPVTDGTATSTMVSPSTDLTQRIAEDQTPTGLFTTAFEVKPILNMTQGSWVAVRNYEGQDLLYFAHLLAWRCGLWGVQYGINDNAPTNPLDLEPCYADAPTPNALNDIETYLPYISLPENSIETVTILLEFDDGTTQTVTFDRAAIQIP